MKQVLLLADRKGPYQIIRRFGNEPCMPLQIKVVAITLSVIQKQMLQLLLAILDRWVRRAMFFLKIIYSLSQSISLCSNLSFDNIASFECTDFKIQCYVKLTKSLYNMTSLHRKCWVHSVKFNMEFYEEYRLIIKRNWIDTIFGGIG